MSDAVRPPGSEDPTGAPAHPAPPARPVAEPARDTAELAADVVAHAGTAAPSPEIAAVSAESGVPGRHLGGFTRLPTEPVGIAEPWVPFEPGASGDPSAQWLVQPPPARPRRGMAAWALAASILGLVVALFVGWGFPLGIAGVVAAILALRSPHESRGVAAWALVLGILSLIYSAGWLLFALTQPGVFG